MSDTVENLILDLLEWLDRKERTYQETMDARRTSCPRLAGVGRRERNGSSADRFRGRLLVRI